MRAVKTEKVTKTQLVVFSGILLPTIGIAVGVVSHRWLGWAVPLQFASRLVCSESWDSQRLSSSSRSILLGEPALRFLAECSQ